MTLAHAATMAEILWVNLVLSADNAIAIAMVANRLPAGRKVLALVLATLAAIAIRVSLTGAVAQVIMLPGAQLLGGLVLVAIAVKLLVEEEEAPQGPADGGMTLGRAVGLILGADLIMSLDNVLAIAAVARGDLLALSVGLSVGIVVVMAFGGFIARLIDRWPWIMYLGAGVIAWAAAGMIVGDALVTRWLAPAGWVVWSAHAAVLLLVISSPRWWRRPSRA